jgi:hypothetical protein
MTGGIVTSKTTERIEILVVNQGSEEPPTVADLFKFKEVK